MPKPPYPYSQVPRRSISAQGGMANAPDRALERTPDFAGAAPDMADPAWAAFHAFVQGRSCENTWWFHDRQEFRMAAAANTVIANFPVTVPSLQQPGFWLRIQTGYEQLTNNILVANGLQVPAMTYRVQIRDQVLNRAFVASSWDGSFWVPYCIRQGDVVQVTAVPAAGIAGQFANAPLRLMSEISVGAPLPELTTVDRRRNTQRTFSVALAAIPLVPTIMIGAGSVFVATIPNAPWFIVPNSLQLQSIPGSAPIFVHGVSVAGAIDAGGQQLDNVVGLPLRLDVDRLDKVAISKPAVLAGTLTISFALYD